MTQATIGQAPKTEEFQALQGGGAKSAETRDVWKRFKAVFYEVFKIRGLSLKNYIPFQSISDHFHIFLVDLMANVNGKCKWQM